MLGQESILYDLQLQGGEERKTCMKRMECTGLYMQIHHAFAALVAELKQPAW